MREDERRARIMAAVTEPDTTAGAGELARRLCRFAVDEMALSGCAIVLMSGAESAGVLAGAGRHAQMVTGLQLELGEGPCLYAHACGIPVLLPDLTAESANRWPVFASRASGEGFQVMCAVPLRVRTHVIGALNLFRGSDEPFTGTEMEIAQAMGEMAAIGLIQERALRERNLLTEQLQAALNSRVVIEQAKGMLAEYLTITVDDAFTLLRNYARDYNRKLSEIASEVVDRKIPSAALAPRPRQQP